MILGALTSFASAAMSSDARFSPYKLMGFGGTFGASWSYVQRFSHFCVPKYGRAYVSACEMEGSCVDT